MQTRKSKGTYDDTVEFQSKYKSLLSICGMEGTMVSQDRLLEADRDIPPCHFFRRGTREYIFPKQDVSLHEDKSRVIDPVPGYGLKTQEQTFMFELKLVTGFIRIEYADATHKPTLRVVDVLGNSEIPEAVKKKLDEIFK